MRTTDKDGKPRSLCEATVTPELLGGGSRASRQTIAENNTALRGVPRSWCSTVGGAAAGREGSAEQRLLPTPVAHTRRRGRNIRQGKVHNQRFFLKPRSTYDAEEWEQQKSGLERRKTNKSCVTVNKVLEHHNRDEKPTTC
ncbi:hypothetical protein E2C01_028496 [Portunus trituberculatus]|uniref:Uncharacterized protein n=1 Tax=Portunus trituberculatus TaxID=210409 RepID=A0A5B7ELP2_PORTR|nr:hypothetical protein [Portunus trituberculatus]